MGTFHINCRLENHVDRHKAAAVPRLLVDTGSEYTWIPTTTLEKIGVAREKKDLAFLMANGQTITRSVGFAIIRFDEYFTTDEVVFAKPGDLTTLGARPGGDGPARGRPPEKTGRFRAIAGGVNVARMGCLGVDVFW